MTKEKIYKSFLEDPLLTENNYINPEKVEGLRFHESTEVKLLEIIKIAIVGNIDEESESITVRKINQKLNRPDYDY
ncbi:hypothetical protein K2F45_11590 [Sphingobacterium siyangense]|uniref:hypothetical protein n=1 Tax=Sphingobacterium siyangense TaxID=459529 RepID=UPI00200CCD9C|nr:hypothetical protein [Sphingobacterium siyangense]UQA77579.1 hypothetical protein K2F45_11590 [Sphingobacterium siyangense]